MRDIFKINQNKNEDLATYVYYTVLGDHSSLDEENYPLASNKKDSLAYSKIINNNSQFYLKIGLNGKIFNPIGLYSEGKQNKFLAKIGREEYSFTRVNEKIFKMYLMFLKTKNLAWLNNAERELA